MMRYTTCTVCLALTAALLAPRWALGRGGPRTDHRPQILSSTESGKNLDIGFYVTPLVGYESNTTVTISQPLDSAVFALEGGVELKYNGLKKLRLRGEASTRLHLPFKHTNLTELLLEVPVLAFYRISPRLELFVLNHLGLERSKTPPIFLDVSSLLDPTRPAPKKGAITYFAAYETLRPALAYHLRDDLHAEIGPYFRFKHIDFIENPYGGEPDYQLFDVGLDISGKYFIKDWLSIRLRYDVAGRFFANYEARPPTHIPSTGKTLKMIRNVIGGLARLRVLKLLSVYAGYDVRFSNDNGGYFDYLDHLLKVGATFSWKEKIEVSSTLWLLDRTYTNRTACEGLKDNEKNTYSDGTCTGKEQDTKQSEAEWALIFNLTASYALSDMIQIVASYEMEDAESDLDDLLIPNHRLMGGASFSF